MTVKSVALVVAGTLVGLAILVFAVIAPLYEWHSANDAKAEAKASRQVAAESKKVSAKTSAQLARVKAQANTSYQQGFDAGKDARTKELEDSKLTYLDGIRVGHREVFSGIDWKPGDWFATQISLNGTDVPWLDNWVKMKECEVTFFSAGSIYTQGRAPSC